VGRAMGRGAGSRPSVSLEEAIDVRSAVDVDAVSRLLDLDTVEFGERAKIFKGRGSFGRVLEGSADNVIDLLRDSLRGGGDGEVVDLAEEEDVDATERGAIDGFVMSSMGEIEFRAEEDGVDLVLPETAGFWVALEGMVNWEDERAIEGDAEALLVPFSIGIINGDVGRNTRRRRVSIGILSIAAIEAIAEGRAKSKEKALNGLFDAGGISLGDAVEERGGFG